MLNTYVFIQIIDVRSSKNGPDYFGNIFVTEEVIGKY